MMLGDIQWVKDYIWKLSYDYFINSYRTVSLFVCLFLCVFESYDDPAVNQARRSAFGGSLRADLVRCAHPGTQYVPQRAESQSSRLRRKLIFPPIVPHCPAHHTWYILLPLPCCCCRRKLDRMKLCPPNQPSILKVARKLGRIEKLKIIRLKL